MNKNKIIKPLANLIFQLVASYQEKNTRLANKIGLSEAEFKCLRLFGSDKRLNNTKIAKRMNLSASRSTRIIDGLVEKGYMFRELDGKDLRALSLTLSRKGKLFIRNLDKSYVDINYKILKKIKISKRKPLMIAMEKLNSASEKWLHKPTKAFTRK
jgi:DNA-binding MarR family transcriptional regulator